VSTKSESVKNDREVTQLERLIAEALLSGAREANLSEGQVVLLLVAFGSMLSQELPATAFGHQEFWSYFASRWLDANSARSKTENSAGAGANTVVITVPLGTTKQGRLRGSRYLVFA